MSDAGEGVLYFLMQGAFEMDVEQLCPPADAEDGNTPRDRPVDPGKLQRVAGRIYPYAQLQAAPVKIGADIVAAAHDQPVDFLKDGGGR